MSIGKKIGVALKSLSSMKTVFWDTPAVPSWVYNAFSDKLMSNVNTPLVFFTHTEWKETKLFQWYNVRARGLRHDSYDQPFT